MSRAHRRAAERWEAIDGDSDSGNGSDPEEELEALRKQVRARVKAAAGGRSFDGAGRVVVIAIGCFAANSVINQSDHAIS